MFLKIKKPSKKQVVSYLQSNYELSEYDKLSISEVNCDMSSYITFKQLFGNQFERNIAIIEEIIKDITIFEDKKILEKRLSEIYSLNDELVQNIKGLNNDEHLGLTNGTIDIEEVFRLAEKYCPDAIWNLECNTSYFDESIKTLKDMGYLK